MTDSSLKKPVPQRGFRHRVATARFGFGLKLSLALALPLLICSTVLVVFFADRTGAAVRRSLIANSQTLVGVMARNIKPNVELDDKLGIAEVLEGLGQGAGLQYATVRKADRQVLARVGDGKDPELKISEGHNSLAEERDEVLHLVQKIGSEPDWIGTLAIGVSLEPARREALDGARVASLALLLVATLGLLLGLGMGRVLARSVRQLAQFASSVIAAGDLTQTLTVHSSDEVGLLADAFRDMLKNQRETVLAIRHSADGLTTLSTDLGVVGKGVTEGFTEIQGRVREASSAIGRMATSLHGVAQSVSDLTETAQTGSATILGVAESSRAVLDKVVHMRTSVEKTSTAVAESATSIGITATSIGEVDRMAVETLASVTQIAEATTAVRANSTETAKLSENATAEAKQGGETLKQTVAGIIRIRDAENAVSTAISALVESSSQIGKIVTVIDDVTDQTALLALNAAIIAAQAGENGRGFSVVADEIKALADRTRKSTDEIGALAREVRSRSSEALTAMASGLASVTDGMKLADQADRAFSRIVASADETARRLRVIADATAKQADNTERARGHVARIVDNVRRITAAATDQSRGAELLKAHAEEMRTLTSAVYELVARQSQDSQRITDAINGIMATMHEVAQAQRTQEADANLVTDASQAITKVTSEQLQSVHRLEAVIAALQRQELTFQTAVQRFRT